ncbi:MAG: HNH endonuclease [Alphaproteobacteria bacterium]|nr:MAG: HNH endonuclease [Alphaproteobacteria bacterium]
MKGRNINWQPNELAWIETNRHMERPVAHKIFCKKFQRSDIKISAYTALCKRKGWLTGRTGRFVVGRPPANKGKKMPFSANSARTQFKKGHLGGKAKEKKKPIGTERITKDGYLEIKIHNNLPLQSRWRAVHLIRWEDTNSPIPDGHCLKCLDGDRSNTDPNNWTCIPRALLPRLAGRWAVPYDAAPAELKPVILTVAKLNHAKHQATKTKDQ